MRVLNRQGVHEVAVETGGSRRAIQIPPKERGFGSSVNGGELLFLALATCYCNDVYREAGKRGLRIEEVAVEVSGEFGGEGEPAQRVSYSVEVRSPDNIDDVTQLLRHTDAVAEIQNSLRTVVPVELARVTVLPTPDGGAV